YVRSREQRLRKQYAQLETRGHLAHRSVVPRLVNAGISQDAARPGLGIVAELVLIQLAETHAGLQHDVAGARFEIAPQQLHERGLAGAVRPDQAIAIPVGKLDRDLFEEGFGAELNGDVGSGKHLYPIKLITAGSAAVALMGILGWGGGVMRTALGSGGRNSNRAGAASLCFSTYAEP